MKKKRLAVLLASVCTLLLTGCLFQSPEDLYQMPERSQGYTMLDQAIRKVKLSLELELGSSPENAVILSGSHTATIQLQDLDGDGVRESALTFLRVPGAEKSLKIYVFREQDGVYQTAGLIEEDGAAIYSVDFVDLNGSGRKELVVNWQVSSGVYQLGAYTLDELQGPLGAPAQNSDRTALLATELLMTSCSSTTDGSCAVRLLDINRDTRTEIAVVRMDATGVSSLVEVYGWNNGVLASLSTVGLSAGAASLNWLASNYLQGDYYTPALYFITTLTEGGKAIDVISFGEAGLLNLTADPETGASRHVLQGYTDVLPSDINGDYILELPNPVPLPTYGDPEATDFWLLEWNQYDDKGKCTEVMTTYHNVQNGWYFVIPDKWKNRITVTTNDSLSGQREVLFARWNGQEKEPEPFLSIYRLTGNNRVIRSTYNGRFVLREEESVIYAAKFYDIRWDCGLTETSILEHFKTIQTNWSGS